MSYVGMCTIVHFSEVYETIIYVSYNVGYISKICARSNTFPSRIEMRRILRKKIMTLSKGFPFRSPRLPDCLLIEKRENTWVCLFVYLES